MRSSKLVPAALALAAIALALPALSGAATEQLAAKMNGNQETAGGDPNGRGHAFVGVNSNKGKVCFQVNFEKLKDPVVAGHIHKGVRGVDGPIKVTLFDEPNGVPSTTVEGCVKNVRRKLAERIADKPKRFYVNIHNDEFPDGAIRGQLKPAL